MTFAKRLESTQLPRRLLGAVLAVLVPGAGHVVLGYSRLGWVIAAVSLLVGGAAVVCATMCVVKAFLVLGAIYIFGTIASVVSIFALPPGPQLKDGLRALWPVLVLFLVIRGAAYTMQTWALVADYAPDASMRPAMERGDTVFSRPGVPDPRPGELVVVEHPSVEGTRYLRRIARVNGDAVELRGDAADEKAVTLPSVSRAQLRARALFVFAAAPGTNGIARVWKPLLSAR